MGLVNSFNNVRSYGFGMNESLVNQCVNNGIGNQTQCADLSTRVGLVACADFGMRGIVGTLGVVHGVQGIQNLIAARKEHTLRERGFQLMKSAIYLGVSAVEIAVALFFPVVTVGGQGTLTMVGSPLSRV